MFKFLSYGKLYRQGLLLNKQLTIQLDRLRVDNLYLKAQLANSRPVSQTIRSPPGKETRGTTASPRKVQEEVVHQRLGDDPLSYTSYGYYSPATTRPPVFRSGGGGDFGGGGASDSWSSSDSSSDSSSSSSSD